MKQTDYNKYSVEDLLQDGYLISSILNPTEESNFFWKNAVENETVDPQKYYLAHYILNLILKSDTVSDEEIDILWERIEEKTSAIHTKKNTRLFRFSLLAVVSGVALILLFFGIKYPFSDYNKVQLSINDVAIPEQFEYNDNIQLILSDNEILSLTERNIEVVYNDNDIIVKGQDIKLNKKQIDNTTLSPTGYNQLIVPKGKQSKLTLEDGSQIWINAGSRVVFPSHFQENKREIFVDGEIYIDVKQNQKQPFIIRSKYIDTEVLGTSFNIMAYENDNKQEIVLVEGIVKISSSENDEKTQLSPNQMYQIKDGVSSIQTVNTDDYTSWKMGVYQYESTRLDVIMNRLSRYYGKKITCTPQVAHLECSGKLDLKDNLENVLQGISHTAPVEYQLKNNIYTITHKIK